MSGMMSKTNPMETPMRLNSSIHLRIADSGGHVLSSQKNWARPSAISIFPPGARWLSLVNLQLERRGTGEVLIAAA